MSDNAHAPTDIADLLAELDRTTADLAVAAEVARERGQEVERLRKVALAALYFFDTEEEVAVAMSYRFPDGWFRGHRRMLDSKAALAAAVRAYRG